jgi:hypothetical protein
MLLSPFRCALTSRLATSPELIPLEDGKYGHQLPQDVAKSWKRLEQSCCQIATVLRSSFERDYPQISLDCPVPPSPSKFGYAKGYSTERKARLALSESVDAFVLLFAYVSFCIAMRRAPEDPPSISFSTSTKPWWYRELSARQSNIHPEFLQLLADSPISDFSTTPQRVGTIINVSRCSWIQLVPRMLKANVPIWLYWGIPPDFIKPLDTNALIFAPRSHPQSRAPPLPVITPSQPVGFPTPSQSTPSQYVGLPVGSAHPGPGQLPRETWKDFMARQNLRRKKKLLNESNVERQARVDRENKAAKMSCPGKKGPTVFIWEDDDGVWTRVHLTRAQVERSWGRYRSSQKIYNSIDNCWDLCFDFDEGTAGEVDNEYDSNDDSDDDIYLRKQSRQSPTPNNRRSSDASDFPSMVVDPTSTPVPMPAQVASDFRSMAIDLTPLSVSLPGQVLPTDVDSTPPPVSLPGQVAPDPLSMVVDATPRPVSSPAQVATRDLSHPDPQCEGDSGRLPTDVDSIPPPVSSPGQVASDPLSMVVNATPRPVSSPAQVATRDLSHPDPQCEGDSGRLPTDVDSTPLPVLSPGQVASDPLSMVVDATPRPVSSPAQVATHDLPNPDQCEGDFAGADEDVEDPYDASRQDVLNAYSFVPLDLEPMPITTLDDLVYYRYGFSLNENPYKGIPSSYKASTYTFRSWPECCRAVGGQQLESSALDRKAIEDFLSILAVCRNPFEDVPGKYWDLSPLGRNPIADLSKVYISIDEMEFTDGTEYFISPLLRFLHTERDTSWFLSVDSMTALECIRRGLGPHTIDIANFFITHGVRFRTFQLIQDSPNSEIPPVRPQRRYLGYRSLNYTFDLADFAGYEVLRDSFLRSQPHGPLALREGGIIARLAREVLPNSNALSGPSSEALGGHRARRVCDDKIYVEDEFSDAELRLICGTYALADTSDTGMRTFLN